MPLVPIEQLKPGMQVAEDVLNVNGMLLLAGGAILGEPSIRVLKMWGVKALKVAGGDALAQEAGPAGGVSPECLAEASRQLSLKLKHVSEDLRVSQTLKQLAVERCAQRLASAKIRPSP